MRDHNTLPELHVTDRLQQAVPILGIVAVGMLAGPVDAASKGEPDRPHLGPPVHEKHIPHVHIGSPVAGVFAVQHGVVYGIYRARRGR